MSTSQELPVEVAEKPEKQDEPETDVKDPENVEFVVPDTSKIRMELPLKNEWALWFLNSNKNLDWTSRLNKISSFNQLQDFLALYDNIRPPSTCMGCDYNLFKEGIEPMWEVVENRDGGRLVLNVDKNRPDVLDSFWSELLFALVGNVFGDDTPSVCGAVCNIRVKGSKISLWTTSAKDDEANLRIGKIMKKIFQDAQTDQFACEVPPIRYEDHKDVQQKSSSKVSEKFII